MARARAFNSSTALASGHTHKSHELCAAPTVRVTTLTDIGAGFFFTWPKTHYTHTQVEIVLLQLARKREKIDLRSRLAHLHTQRRAHTHTKFVRE